MKVVRSAVQVEKEMIKMMTSEFSGIDLREAQDAAYVTAAELGVKETKAKFLEKNMKEFQIKTIYPFVGRVKRMPDFGKMNPAAKNFVCWFTAIADKNSGGASTMEERKATAIKIYDKLLSIAKKMLGEATEETKNFTEEIDENLKEIIGKVSSELEAMEEFTSKAVKSLAKNKEQMRDVIIQSIGMYIQDVNNMPAEKE